MRFLRLGYLALAVAAVVSGCDSARDLGASGAGECNRCHGFPPPPFLTDATAHPDRTDCSTCHPSTVDANGDLIAGGAHLNGTVDAGHPVGWAQPSQHGPAAIADIASGGQGCTVCHGDDYGGGTVGISCNACHTTNGFADWRTNCTFCHGAQTTDYPAIANPVLAAPPEGVLGQTEPTDAHVGAHQKHLGNGSTISDGVSCDECHVVPTDLSHLDGAATLTFGALATTGSLVPQYAGVTCSSVYCHGATLNGGANPTPSWTGAIGCLDCHGQPPQTVRHPTHSFARCVNCHSEVATNTTPANIASTPTAKALHVNGQKNVSFSAGGTFDPAAKTCSNTACHGAETKTWQ